MLEQYRKPDGKIYMMEWWCKGCNVRQYDLLFTSSGHNPDYKNDWVQVFKDGAHVDSIKGLDPAMRFCNLLIENEWWPT